MFFRWMCFENYTDSARIMEVENEAMYFYILKEANLGWTQFLVP